MKIIKELTFVDKTDWGPGPWQNEPDKVQMLDEETDLDCLIVRNHGNLCGYVGVTEDHPWYGDRYQEKDADVHGGLTFAGFCVEDDKNHGICHTPLAGRPDRVYWFGFDCGHAFDLDPEMEVTNKKYGLPTFTMGHQIYRDVEYVKSECTKLAKQLKEEYGKTGRRIKEEKTVIER